MSDNPVGILFGRLTPIRRASRAKHWVCRCTCGVEKAVRIDALRTGNTQSCGCLALEHPSRLLHGHARIGLLSAEYHAWCSAKARCHNKNNKRYSAYGARGITMCDLWRDDFRTFLKHVGERPSSRHSIERIDTNLGYEPGNVRWATHLEQANNKTNNLRFMHLGQQMTLAQISAAESIPYHALYRSVVSRRSPLNAAIESLRHKQRHALPEI